MRRRRWGSRGRKKEGRRMGRRGGGGGGSGEGGEGEGRRRGW